MEITVNVNGQDFVVDFDKLNPDAQRYFATYGIKQSLADAGASKETPADKRKAASDRLARIESGDIPSGGGGGSVDPVASALVMLLKTAKVRKLATMKYTPEDVPSARDRVAVDAFVSAHFGEDAMTRLATAADHIATAKRLDV